MWESVIENLQISTFLLKRRLEGVLLNPFLCVFFIIFLIPYTSYSQTKELSGFVESNNGDVVGLNVISKKSGRGTITDQNGRFSILVEQNDTLLISSIQYGLKIVPVNNFLHQPDPVKINLQETPIELKEVVVSNHYLTGDLLYDINSLKLEKVLSNEDLGLPNPQIRRLSYAERELKHSSTGAINLLINVLTGRLKQVKKEIKAEKVAGYFDSVKSKLNDSFFIDHLNIPPNNIDGFSIYCCEDENLVQIIENSNDLELVTFFEKKSKEFLTPTNYSATSSFNR